MKYVFSGHEHLFYQSVHDGVNYVVTGGGGAPSSVDLAEGGYQHYVLVYVNEGGISLAVLEPWRLFVEVAPVLPDGTCSAIVSNYHNRDVTVGVEFPSDALGAEVGATASFTYKGQTHPVSVAIVPSRRPGTVMVSVTVPRSRAAVVTLAPARK